MLATPPLLALLAVGLATPRNGSCAVGLRSSCLYSGCCADPKLACYKRPDRGRAKANDAVRRLNAQALQEAAEENLEY